MYDVDTGAPIKINPYAGKDREISMELVED